MRVPADGQGGVLPGLAVWFAGASGATSDEGREPRHGARAAVAARAAGGGRDLQEPRHGVHAVGRVGKGVKNEVEDVWFCRNSASQPPTV